MEKEGLLSKRYMIQTIDIYSSSNSRQTFHATLTFTATEMERRMKRKERGWNRQREKSQKFQARTHQTMQSVIMQFYIFESRIEFFFLPFILCYSYRYVFFESNRTAREGLVWKIVNDDEERRGDIWWWSTSDWFKWYLLLHLSGFYSSSFLYTWYSHYQWYFLKLNLTFSNWCFTIWFQFTHSFPNLVKNNDSLSSLLAFDIFQIWSSPSFMIKWSHTNIQFEETVTLNWQSKINVGKEET